MRLVRFGTANVTLSWPVGWNEFFPLQSTNLSEPWTDVGQNPLNDGTNWFLNLTATNPYQFYRLRKP
jgi:hypothetical protein